MINNMPQFDQAIMELVSETETQIESTLECDLLYYLGELRQSYVAHFRDSIEFLAQRDGKRNAIGICLTTPGGQAEAVEKMAEILRYHYKRVYFIVPRTALSAGTIFCMSGDKIYMDYSSSLGPIDPQVPDKEDKVLVPALGYLDKVQELVEKSRNNTITPAEFSLLEKQDLAMLRFYEQARDLSIELLKQWLVKFKFADWTHHRTTNPGAEVTREDKENRAEEIARLLSDNNHWHSHGRMIGMQKLKDILRLEIDDYGADKALQKNIRRYSDTLTDYVSRSGRNFCLHNRHLLH